METPHPIVLLLLWRLDQRLARIESGQRREERRTVKISDAITSLGAKVAVLSDDDTQILAALAAKDELSPEDEATIDGILTQLDADHAAAQGALNPTPATPVDPGTGDAGTAPEGDDNGAPVTTPDETPAE